MFARYMKKKGCDKVNDVRALIFEEKFRHKPGQDQLYCTRKLDGKFDAAMFNGSKMETDWPENGQSQRSHTYPPTFLSRLVGYCVMST